MSGDSLSGTTTGDGAAESIKASVLFSSLSSTSNQKTGLKLGTAGLQGLKNTLVQKKLTAISDKNHASDWSTPALAFVLLEKVSHRNAQHFPLQSFFFYSIRSVDQGRQKDLIKICIMNRHKAVQTILDNTFRSVSRQIKYDCVCLALLYAMMVLVLAWFLAKC